MAPSAKKTPSLKKEMKEERESDRPMQEKKKMGQDIEVIFRVNRKKRKESCVPEDSATKSEGLGKAQSKKKKIAKEEKEKKNGYTAVENSESHAKRRRTADGLPIYSAEELGVGNSEAGSTALCPFDCSCCF